MPPLPITHNECAPARGKSQGALCFVSTTTPRPQRKDNDNDLLSHQIAHVQR